MRNDDAQMLLLTGIVVILISIAAASISSDLSNIDVKVSAEESHPLYQEFFMIKEKIMDLYSQGLISDQEDLVLRIDDFQFIEAKYGIDISATLIVDPSIIYLCLEDENTKICEKFYMGP